MTQMEDFNSVRDYLLALKPTSIFDSGFGDCKWAEWAIKHNMKFEGIEIDPELVKKGREGYPQFASLLHEGDLTEDGLDKIPDNSHDVVLFIEVIEHIKTPELAAKVLKNCLRIARSRVIITTPNCGDEDLLRQNGLIYVHFTHVATEGMKFTKEKSHRHWIRFTKENLTQLLAGEFKNFKVIEKSPIQILKPVCYNKLWAEIVKE